MKVALKMLDKQLRFKGMLLRLLLNNKSEQSLRSQDISRWYFVGNKPKDLQYEEVWLPRPDGTEMRVVVYKPLHSVANAPGLLWVHGGGYAIGAPEMGIAFIRLFIANSNCVVVAPDYRRLPEAPYPAALEDSYLALRWLKDQAPALGVRLDQLAVGGDSAGGGLTAALSLYARDKGEVNLAFQLPLYPMLDDRSSTESARENDAPVWDATTNRSAWKLYLGPLYGQDEVPAYDAPARATDYRQLPPTITYIGDVDVFRDEVKQYVVNLRAADVPVDFQLYTGAYHGFELICPGAEVSKAALTFLTDRFYYAIQHYFWAQLA